MKFKLMKPNTTEFRLLDENLEVAAVRNFSIYGEMSKIKKKNGRKKGNVHSIEMRWWARTVQVARIHFTNYLRQYGSKDICPFFWQTLLHLKE